MDKEFTREELFLLVWERPSQEIAREMGISDVALSKRCRKLQVPKPPPGYWARVRAGKRPRKPILKEFSEQLAQQQNKRAKRNNIKRSWLDLAPLQAEIFKKAVDEASIAGIDLGEMEITRAGVRLLDGELAAQLIMIIQHHYMKWLRERATSKQIAHPSVRSVQSLVSKLLPLAKPHTLVLQKEADRYDGPDRHPKVIIRSTPEFRQQVANLHRLVVGNDLSYVVWSLGPFEHAWIVQYHYHYEGFASARSQLCVSRDSLWVDCRIIRHSLYDEHEEIIKTVAIPLAEIAPVDLIRKADVLIPAVVDLPQVTLSEKRIKAFLDAENAYDILSSVVYNHDYPVPDEHLVLLEKLQMGSEGDGPLTAARAACRKLEDDMERWELLMESEREAICAEALGLSVGDTILSESQGKPIRLKINHMSTHVTENNTLRFFISGQRYRKDGLLGKRDDTIFISTESGRKG
jgi:hypothetical protein